MADVGCEAPNDSNVLLQCNVLPENASVVGFAVLLIVLLLILLFVRHQVNKEVTDE